LTLGCRADERNEVNTVQDGVHLGGAAAIVVPGDRIARRVRMNSACRWQPNQLGAPHSESFVGTLVVKLAQESVGLGLSLKEVGAGQHERACLLFN
jgi:hypothetical protein